MTADHPAPGRLVDPGPDSRTAEQASTRRWPWSKPKVQTKPTRADRREFRRATRQP